MTRHLAIALTGGTGLIGSAVRNLLSESHPVVTIGRRRGADLVADLSQPDAVAAMDLSGCEALVHCAGIVDEDFTNSERAFRQATQGMAALVARAKAAGIRRFVYVSSAHIYGRFTGVISEASTPNPLHDYAIAHFASEQILRRATTPDFQALVLRPCAVFGIPPELARFRRWALIPFGFPKAAVEDGVIALASRGLQRRNFVGTEDIAQQIKQWLCEKNENPFTALNCVGKESMTVLAFAEMCSQISEKVTGRKCRITRPDGDNPEPDSFEYTTSETARIGKTDLGATLEHLTRMLSGSHVPAAEVN